jgi:hypothetical protein
LYWAERAFPHCGETSPAVSKSFIDWLTYCRAGPKRTTLHLKRGLQLEAIFHISKLLSALFREPKAAALRAHAVGKLHLRALPDVQLDLLPVSVVILDFLTGSAEGEQTAQSIYAFKGLLQFPDQLVLYGFVAFAVADVVR